MGAGHVGLRPRLINEHQPLGIEVDLPIEPGPSPPQDVRSVLFARVTCLFFARDPMAREEPLDRTIAEPVALPGECPAQFLDRDVRCLLDDRQDQCSLRFNSARAAVTTQGPGACMALCSLQRPPPAHTRRAHSKACSRGAMVHALGNNIEDTGSKIQRKGSRHACRPPSTGRQFESELVPFWESQTLQSDRVSL